jgi:hypothetical protein
VIGPTPLLDSFKRGEVPRDVKMLAAAGALAPRAYEQLSILVLLVGDADAEVRGLAEVTLNRIPAEALRTFLAQPDIPLELRDFFVNRDVVPVDLSVIQAAIAATPDVDAPLIDTDPSDVPDDAVDDDSEDAEARRESVSQKLSAMGFVDKLKAAVKGTREMRSILIRDPSKMIAAAVLSSPKVTDAEVAGFARMGNVSEDVLRIIGHNRAWLKNYSVVLALTKNSKTPVAMSMNLMNRLSNRDLATLATDRNIPEALRVAARKRVASAREG